MPLFAAIRQSHRLCFIALALASLFRPGTAAAQQFQFGFADAPQAELTPPRVDLVSGPTSARLEQARALAADKNWDEAIDTLRELADDDTGGVVPLHDGCYVSLRTYCHLQLARFPVEGLLAYRRRVDPLAEQWYRQGVAGRDERMLRRVTDELFCSSWGDDALLALGELALERADYEAARRSWEQICPLLRDPSGRPLWIALRDVDLSVHWSEIERRWFERTNPPEWLAYPDTLIDLADIRARLILVSIRERQLDRAALEINVFRRLHPTAHGRLGGQEGPYVAALERLLESAREWPDEKPDSNWTTLGGSQSRSSIAAPIESIAGPAWSEPVTLSTRPHASVHDSQLSLSCFPIVIGDIVVFSDALQIRAVDLATGRPAITPDGVLHRHEMVAGLEDGNQFAAREVENDAIYGASRCTLTAANGVVYGRVGFPSQNARSAPRGESTSDRIIGVDLTREGLLTFHARPDDSSWSFDGAPICDGRRVWIAMRRSDVTPHVYVACFDAASGAQLWHKSIGSADTPGAARGSESPQNLLTLVGNRVFFNTNLGVVAALDADDGQICWLHRYDRLSSKWLAKDHGGATCLDRDPSPCLYHDGLLIVAPSDAPDIFALDTQTGQRVWTSHQFPDALHLLGVVQNNLVISGNRVGALDVRSGSVRYVWPESEHAGIRGMGRGLVAGSELFWPTRTEIYVVHALTGEQTRSPISLGKISDGGANLAAAHGRLIVAGPDKLMAVGPTASAKPNVPTKTETAFWTDRVSGWSDTAR